MGIPSWPGRDGIRIQESGLADLISRSDSALESAGSADLDGDGDIGDLTGTTITQCLTTADIFRAAGRFITATTSGAESRAVRLSMAESEPVRSRETGRRPVDTLLLAVRVAYARACSAATITVESPEAILPADAPASAAGRAVVAERMAAEVTVVA